MKKSLYRLPLENNSLDKVQVTVTWPKTAGPGGGGGVDPLGGRESGTCIWKGRGISSSRVQIKDSGLTSGVDDKTSPF